MIQPKNQIMKKNILLLLAVFLSGMVNAEDVSINGITYYLQSDMTAQVKKCYDSHMTDVVIPSVIEINGIEYSVTRIAEFAFNSCQSLSSISLPESVTSIAWSAFQNCSSLSSIHLPESLKLIGANAFSRCRNLSSITIPQNVTTIGSRAFEDCSGLTSFVIPPKVKTIEYCTFSGCSGFTSFTIPENIQNIASGAFSNCSRLKEVIVKRETPPTIDSDTFPNRVSQTLYVPKGCKSAYENADYWWGFKVILEEGTSQTAASGDVNGDGIVNIIDVMMIINMIIEAQSE